MRTTKNTARRTVAAAAAAVALVATAVALPATASATGGERLHAIGLTDGGKGLVYFQTDRPNKAKHVGGVQGLKDGDTRLVGIDYRVQNGKLYGVADKGGIYLLSEKDARATKVGQLSARNTTLNAQAGRIAHDLEADSCAS